MSKLNTEVKVDVTGFESVYKLIENMNRMLDKLGITVEDIEGKSIDELNAEIAKRLDNMETIQKGDN